MASCSTLKASSSASNCDTYNYHVFMSFRGEDTRNNFTDHLHANLVAHGIHTFRDEEELEKGGHIASNLWRAIKESKIFIIIFSKNYATSKWCLNELVKIVECMRRKGSVVLPVFYHVEPRDVRNQGGSFEKAFLEHAKDADQAKEKTIETWKEALKIAGGLDGYEVKNESEAKLIQKIRGNIIKILDREPLHVGDNIVGMDFHLEQLKSLIKTELDEVRMVGIYGTGGIGKTTIAKVVYNDISSQFDGSSFLENVGGKCENGLLKLQKSLLRNILKSEKPDFSTPSEGINVIKNRLRSKKVLIVLDDVDNKKELDCFAGKCGWYGAKSIIIITTRDKHLLIEYEVDADYKVQNLNYEKSTELFNLSAFKQSTPKPKFESLSNSLVEYADGLPIALTVLGGFLFNKSIQEWNSFMHKLKEMPNRTVQSVLKVSYDKLDSIEQSIFLDIACFFRGKDKDFVSRILGSCAEIGIKVLNDRCLITIAENKLYMHDLLQKMGQEIIRQECPQEPGKRSRLWDPSDVNSVLTNNTGTEAIEGLSFQILELNQKQFTTNAFKRMNRLKLLKIYTRYSNVVDLPTDLEFPSSELRYLHFDRYSLESLPTNFCGKKLVELDLQYSEIKQLWKGNKILDNLKVINLTDSRKLIEIPDFSSVPNLEILTLEGCTSLVSLPKNFHKLQHLRSLNLQCTAIAELPSLIGHLKALTSLDLRSCTNLRSLPESICNLTSLERLIVECCYNLKGFPEIKDDMENLQMLDLSSTCIEELPSSIGHLKALKHLELSSCTKLRSLPDSICNLSSLEKLIVKRCSNLKGFLEIKDDMKELQTLDLSSTAIEELPSSIGHLKNLQRLDLSETYIEELPSSIGHLKALKHLNLSFCENLRSLPESICNLSSLETLIIQGCSELERFEVGLVGFLYPTCCILKQGVIWNTKDFFSLKTLNLQCNQLEAEVLNHHIFRLSSLVELSIRNSDHGEDGASFYSSSLKVCSVGNFNPMARGILGDIFHRSSLVSLSLYDCNLIEEGIRSDIFHQSSLERLSLDNCNLVEEDILNHIFHLSSLQSLSLDNCNLVEEDILNHIFHLSSLQSISLEGNHFSSIPAGISRLSNLRGLNLSHCKKLQDIPKLPSSLLFLDAQGSDGISSSPSLLLSHSLFNGYKPELIQETEISVGSSHFRGEGISIVIPRSSGILEGIRNQNMGSGEVTIELPPNWYENNDLVGFALYCVYVRIPDDEFNNGSASGEFECDEFDNGSAYDDTFSFESRYGLNCGCKLTIGGNYPSEDVDKSSCQSIKDGEVWVIYCPKNAIEKKYRSNQCTHLKASFSSSIKNFLPKDCWIHLIDASRLKCESLPSTICELNTDSNTHA